MLALAAPVAGQAKSTIRIATLNSGLVRAGPGLLVRDILRGDDEQVLAVRDLIAASGADIVLLTRIDHDFGQQALKAFAALLRPVGADYPWAFSQTPNAGMATGRDMDRDGMLGGPRDAQGYGEFAGQGGMAILSKFPIELDHVRDFSALLWRDLPGAALPDWPEAQADPEIDAIQRLSSVGHWSVPVRVDGARLTLLAYHATTPAFDGPEDRNGRRNRDETLFWLRYLDGALGEAPPVGSFVLLGDANLDPVDGDGDQRAIRALLSDPRLQDPRPSSQTGAKRAEAQGGVNRAQLGDAALDTADWRDVDGPGNLRVDYVLPSADLTVVDAGLLWSEDIDVTPLRHALVWVDIEW